MNSTEDIHFLVTESALAVVKSVMEASYTFVVLLTNRPLDMILLFLLMKLQNLTLNGWS